MTVSRKLHQTSARRAIIASLLIPFALGACKEYFTVSPVQNNLASFVDFVMGDGEQREMLTPLEFLEVTTCKADSTEAPTDQLMWRIEPGANAKVVKLSRIGYGETPPGARVVVEAQPLVNTCYWVRNDKARYRFRKYASGMSGSGPFLANDPIFKRK